VYIRVPGGRLRTPWLPAAAAAATAVGAGVAWLVYEDKQGRLSGGPFEPLTLRVAAVMAAFLPVLLCAPSRLCPFPLC